MPAADPARRFRANPFADLGGQLRIIARDRVLGWAVAGNTYLWFLAALLQFVIVIYGHDVLRVNETQISYLQAAVGIGIGVGSLVAGYLSAEKSNTGWFRWARLGMTVFGFLSRGMDWASGRCATESCLLGFFGGFYAVPLNALIQHRPGQRKRAASSRRRIFFHSSAYSLRRESILRSPRWHKFPPEECFSPEPF